MRTCINVALSFLLLMPGFGRGADEIDFKALSEYPLERVYKVRDDNGRRLSLLQWRVGSRFYFVLRVTATGETLETAVADSMKTVPTIYRDEEYQMTVQAESKAKDGKVIPAVYEKRVRKVPTQSEFSNYLKDGKVVVSVPNSALPGVLPDVTMGETIYMGGHERAGGSLENLIDEDSKTPFSLEKFLRGGSPPVAKPEPLPSPDEYTIFDSIGRNTALYVWDFGGKWFFLQVEGKCVKKKIVADSRLVVPGVYERKIREVCVKGASIDEKGNFVPSIYVEDSSNAPIRFETTFYTGVPEQIQWMSNRKLTVGGELYSLVHEPAEDYKGGRPVKGKEADF